MFFYITDMSIQRVNNLRAEADAATARADEEAAKAKLFEEEKIKKEEEVETLKNKIARLETDLEETEKRLAETTNK